MQQERNTFFFELLQGLVIFDFVDCIQTFFLFEEILVDLSAPDRLE